MSTNLGPSRWGRLDFEPAAQRKRAFPHAAQPQRSREFGLVVSVSIKTPAVVFDKQSELIVQTSQRDGNVPGLGMAHYIRESFLHYTKTRRLEF
jgi:hypothetical protein